MTTPKFVPQVLLDANTRPVLVFAHGRTKYHAVATHKNTLHLVVLDTLRGLLPATRAGEAYSPKRAASYWLNHSSFEITPRAKAVLRALVRRGQQEAT